VKEIVDATDAAGLGADRLDKLFGADIDPAFGVRIARGVSQERRGEIFVRRSERRVKNR
jgi:hypothetical protein